MGGAGQRWRCRAELCGNRLSVCSRIKFNEPQLIVHDNTIKTFTKNYILFSFSTVLFFPPSPRIVVIAVSSCSACLAASVVVIEQARDWAGCECPDEPEKICGKLPDLFPWKRCVICVQYFQWLVEGVLGVYLNDGVENSLWHFMAHNWPVSSFGFCADHKVYLICHCCNCNCFS